MKKLLLFNILILVNSVGAQVDLTSVKCALTYRIMHFTDIGAPSNTYHLCVDGSDDFYDAFKIQLKGKQLKGSEISVLKATEQNIQKCSLLYLGDSSHINEKTVSKYMEENKLIVFTSEESKKDFSIILFNQLDSKVNFKVNKSLLDKNGVKMSSKVLRLASEVY